VSVARVPDCIFCEVIAGRLPGSFVHRDDLVVAFLDTKPVNEGHLLVAPVRHVERLADLDEGSASRVWQIGRLLAGVLASSGLRGEGLNLVVNDGVAAQQTIAHFHLHVLPRFAGDGFGYRFPPGYGKLRERQTLDALADRLAALVPPA
jgi:diadenosine tetraphosphate (Ap4A) HIT family hydrolase